MAGRHQAPLPRHSDWQLQPRLLFENLLQPTELTV